MLLLHSHCWGMDPMRRILNSGPCCLTHPAPAVSAQVLQCLVESACAAAGGLKPLVQAWLMCHGDAVQHVLEQVARWLPLLFLNALRESAAVKTPVLLKGLSAYGCRNAGQVDALDVLGGSCSGLRQRTGPGGGGGSDQGQDNTAASGGSGDYGGSGSSGAGASGGAGAGSAGGAGGSGSAAGGGGEEPPWGGGGGGGGRGVQCGDQDQGERDTSQGQEDEEQEGNTLGQVAEAIENLLAENTSQPQQLSDHPSAADGTQHAASGTITSIIHVSAADILQAPAQLPPQAAYSCPLLLAGMPGLAEQALLQAPVHLGSAGGQGSGLAQDRPPQPPSAPPPPPQQLLLQQQQQQQPDAAVAGAAGVTAAGSQVQVGPGQAGAAPMQVDGASAGPGQQARPAGDGLASAGVQVAADDAVPAQCGRGRGRGRGPSGRRGRGRGRHSTQDSDPTSPDTAIAVGRGSRGRGSGRGRGRGRPKKVVQGEQAADSQSRDDDNLGRGRGRGRGKGRGRGRGADSPITSSPAGTGAGSGQAASAGIGSGLSPGQGSQHTNGDSSSDDDDQHDADFCVPGERAKGHGHGGGRQPAAKRGGCGRGVAVAASHVTLAGLGRGGRGRGQGRGRGRGRGRGQGLAGDVNASNAAAGDGGAAQERAPQAGVSTPVVERSIIDGDAAAQPAAPTGNGVNAAAAAQECRAPAISVQQLPAAGDGGTGHGQGPLGGDAMHTVSAAAERIDASADVAQPQGALRQLVLAQNVHQSTAREQRVAAAAPSGGQQLAVDQAGQQKPAARKRGRPAKVRPGTDGIQLETGVNVASFKAARTAVAASPLRAAMNALHGPYEYPPSPDDHSPPVARAVQAAGGVQAARTTHAAGAERIAAGAAGSTVAAGAQLVRPVKPAGHVRRARLPLQMSPSEGAPPGPSNAAQVQFAAWQKVAPAKQLRPQLGCPLSLAGVQCLDEARTTAAVGVQLHAPSSVPAAASTFMQLDTSAGAGRAIDAGVHATGQAADRQAAAEPTNHAGTSLQRTAAGQASAEAAAPIVGVPPSAQPRDARASLFAHLATVPPAMASAGPPPQHQVGQRAPGRAQAQGGAEGALVASTGAASNVGALGAGASPPSDMSGAAPVSRLTPSSAHEAAAGVDHSGSGPARILPGSLVCAPGTHPARPARQVPAGQRASATAAAQGQVGQVHKAGPVARKKTEPASHVISKARRTARSPVKLDPRLAPRKVAPVPAALLHRLQGPPGPPPAQHHGLPEQVMGQHTDANMATERMLAAGQVSGHCGQLAAQATQHVHVQDVQGGQSRGSLLAAGPGPSPTAAGARSGVHTGGVGSLSDSLAAHRNAGTLTNRPFGSAVQTSVSSLWSPSLPMQTGVMPNMMQRRFTATAGHSGEDEESERAARRPIHARQGGGAAAAYPAGQGLGLGMGMGLRMEHEGQYSGLLELGSLGVGGPGRLSAQEGLHLDAPQSGHEYFLQGSYAGSTAGGGLGCEAAAHVHQAQLGGRSQLHQAGQAEAPGQYVGNDCQTTAVPGLTSGPLRQPMQQQMQRAYQRQMSKQQDQQTFHNQHLSQVHALRAGQQVMQSPLLGSQAQGQPYLHTHLGNSQRQASGQPAVPSSPQETGPERSGSLMHGLAGVQLVGAPASQAAAGSSGAKRQAVVGPSGQPVASLANRAAAARHSRARPNRPPAVCMPGAGSAPGNIGQAAAQMVQGIPPGALQSNTLAGTSREAHMGGVHRPHTETHQHTGHAAHPAVPGNAVEGSRADMAPQRQQPQSMEANDQGMATAASQTAALATNCTPAGPQNNVQAQQGTHHGTDNSNGQSALTPGSLMPHGMSGQQGSAALQHGQEVQDMQDGREGHTMGAETTPCARHEARPSAAAGQGFVQQGHAFMAEVSIAQLENGDPLQVVQPPAAGPGQQPRQPQHGPHQGPSNEHPGGLAFDPQQPQQLQQRMLHHACPVMSLAGAVRSAPSASMQGPQQHYMRTQQIQSQQHPTTGGDQANGPHLHTAGTGEFNQLPRMHVQPGDGHLQGRYRGLQQGAPEGQERQNAAAGGGQQAGPHAYNHAPHAPGQMPGMQIEDTGHDGTHGARLGAATGVVVHEQQQVVLPQQEFNQQQQDHLHAAASRVLSSHMGHAAQPQAGAASQAGLSGPLPAAAAHGQQRAGPGTSHICMHHQEQEQAAAAGVHWQQAGQHAPGPPQAQPQVMSHEDALAAQAACSALELATCLRVSLHNVHGLLTLLVGGLAPCPTKDILMELARAVIAMQTVARRLPGVVEAHLNRAPPAHNQGFYRRVDVVATQVLYSVLVVQQGLALPAEAIMMPQAYPACLSNMLGVLHLANIGLPSVVASLSAGMPCVCTLQGLCMGLSEFQDDMVQLVHMA